VKLPPDPRPAPRPRRPACPAAFHGHRWSMTARLYVGGCLRLPLCGDGQALDALLDRLDTLDRKMAAREREEVNRHLSRLQPLGDGLDG
jgi:hypothetical protein